jgi:hypothetical protein
MHINSPKIWMEPRAYFRVSMDSPKYHWGPLCPTTLLPAFQGQAASSHLTTPLDTPCASVYGTRKSSESRAASSNSISISASTLSLAQKCQGDLIRLTRQNHLSLNSAPEYSDSKCVKKGIYSVRTGLFGSLRGGGWGRGGDGGGELKVPTPIILF